MIPGIVAGQMRAAAGGPIQYIGTSVVSQGSAGSATGKTLFLPAGTQIGDFAVLLIESYNGLYVPTLAGWTKALNLSGVELNDRRYRVLATLDAIALPAHNSRYLARVMIFRNVPAGGTVVALTAYGNGTTVDGSITIPASTTTYVAGNHYIIPTMYNRATSSAWTVSAPYPQVDAVTQHVTPPTTAYAALATCGAPWSGGGAVPAQTWHYQNAAYSAAQVLLIKGA